MKGRLLLIGSRRVRSVGAGRGAPSSETGGREIKNRYGYVLVKSLRGVKGGVVHGNRGTRVETRDTRVPSMVTPTPPPSCSFIPTHVEAEEADCSIDPS